MERLASIDCGTNTVLLLVAEVRGAELVPVVERAEITRLGRGVDRTGRLDPDAIRDTVAVLARFAAEARSLGAREIVCVATSAARDAQNSAQFFTTVQDAAGLTPRVISGEEEARLVHGSAWQDFGAQAGGSGTLAVLDVGGGSTEFTFGDGPIPRGRRSLQIGAVRLTERVAPADPMRPDDLDRLLAGAQEAVKPLAELPGFADLGSLRGGHLVGVAGTVTTLAAVDQQLPTHDAVRVHGSTLSLAALERIFEAMGRLPLAERARLPGMEPKRADVIVAGCAVTIAVMRLADFDRLFVSDRGVRWGLLQDLAGFQAGGASGAVSPGASPVDDRPPSP
jgi:exopolyphosphatase/guanosine-5'-triphosphate,3'-diphosphate pyrophosphatase